jgi:SAM-dependent methyltransferase
MTEWSPTFRRVFFDVYEGLPRQGPGNRATAARALAVCRDLPKAPDILDMGCGVGTQSMYLAELTAGRIVAVDSHAPMIDRLTRTIAEKGLSDRVRGVVGDMADTGFAPGSFDLVWSEGALYFIGIETALTICRKLLRPGGYVAFTDSVWKKADPPADLRESFGYPEMGRVEDILATAGRCGYEVLDHFPIPPEAWWDDFYTPMEARTAELRPVYAGDADALAALDEVAGEPAMHREFSDYYDYEFFVLRT